MTGNFEVGTLPEKLLMLVYSRPTCFESDSVMNRTRDKESLIGNEENTFELLV